MAWWCGAAHGMGSSSGGSVWQAGGYARQTRCNWQRSGGGQAHVELTAARGETPQSFTVREEDYAGSRCKSPV